MLIVLSSSWNITYIQRKERYNKNRGQRKNREPLEGRKLRISTVETAQLRNLTLPFVDLDSSIRFPFIPDHISDLIQKWEQDSKR